MRELSQAIKDVLAADYGETKDVVIIKIPEQVGAVTYPETTLYLANGDGVFVDGVNYENKLRSISAISLSLSKAPDGASFVIENVSRTFGFTLTDFQRALDGSKVEIKRVFKTQSGNWESDSIFYGYITEVKVSQEDVQITCTSDMSRRGTSVAGRTMSQRCLNVFNVNGSGIGIPCFWQTSQPGNPLSCDKGLDTANGCKSHGNQHRFGGIPAFTALSEGNGYDSHSGGWGQGSGGGWCITLDSWVLVSLDGGRYWKKAHTLIVGDKLVSIDKFGRFVETIIAKPTIGNTTRVYTLSTESGYSLSCSPTHPVMKSYVAEEGVPVNTLSVQDEVLCYDYASGLHLIDRIASIEVIDMPALVLLLDLEAPYHLFMAGKEKTGAIVSHNNKPIYTDNMTQIVTGFNLI